MVSSSLSDENFFITLSDSSKEEMPQMWQEMRGKVFLHFPLDEKIFEGVKWSTGDEYEHWNDMHETANSKLIVDVGSRTKHTFWVEL